MKTENCCCNNCVHLDKDMKFEGISRYIEMYKYGCCKQGDICQYISSDRELKDICCATWCATAEDMMKNRPMAVEFETLLNQEYRRWDDIMAGKSSDPNWSDGINANLVRNHIIYLRGRVEQFLGLEDYPKSYYRLIPDEVDGNYMVSPDEIMAKAKTSLRLYDDCSDFIWIKENRRKLNPKSSLRRRADNVINYRESLGIALEERDYLTMRRHAAAETYLDAFRIFRGDMEAVLSKRKNKDKEEKPVHRENGERNGSDNQLEGQISIFDIGIQVA